ncbi:MAG: DUF1499 domain-containing protein [Dongiaceae bacterium]
MIQVIGRTARWLIAVLLGAVMAACSADTLGIEFAALVRPTTPNSYLVCPADRCAATADALGPVYAIPAAELFGRIRTILSTEPRTRVVQDQPERLRLVLVQRSRIFRFPDTITVQLFPLPDGGAALAMYSHSNYGRSDLGVNKERVQRWLSLIDAEVARL